MNFCGNPESDQCLVLCFLESFTLENHCTRTAQSSWVAAVDKGTKYTSLVYCDTKSLVMI